jgi:hypothetical protein
MNESPTSPFRSGRRARIAAASALVIAVAAALYLVLVSGSSGARSTNGNAGSRYTGSTTVQRRNLVEEDTESGTLGHPHSYTVYNRVSGTVTWLPSAGDVIKPGQTLFRIDNKPVLLMDGTTPAYRDLSSSDSPGPDILELNANLVDLGYNPDGIIVDDTWQAATTAAVKELQYDLGEGQSGKILLGKIVFLPGKQLVSSVLGSVGSTVALTDPSPQAEFVSLDTTTDTGAATDTTAATTTTTTTDATTNAATAPTTTPATTTPTNTPPTTTTPPAATTQTTTTPPRTTTDTTTTPKKHAHTTPARTTPARTTPTTTTTHRQSTTDTPSNSPPGKTPSPSTSSQAPSHSTTGASGGDNLSAQTLKALLQLVRQQQQALAHQNSPGHSSNNGTPSTNSKSPSSSSKSPSSSSKSSSGSSKSSSGSSKSSSGSSKSPSSSSNSPTHSSRQPSPSAGGGGAGTAIMDTTSTQLVVTVDLSPSSQSEAVIGGHVTVEMPDGSTVPGTISAVSSVAQSSSSGGATGNTGSGGGSSSVPVTVTLDKHVSSKGLDQAAVSVNFVQARANHVLSVPVTALLATSGSTYAVQEASPQHTLIPVRTGMFAAGYVEISGSRIHPGLRVTDSQG